ncbi:MAG: hypothetical protein ACOC6G_03645, partial [Thermoproteota archaeon]
EYLIAEIEKAVLDSLYLPKYAGGYQRIENCIVEGWQELDTEKLVEYAVKMDNNSLISRLGFLIERNGLEMSKNLMKDLLDHRSRTYVPIYSEEEKNERWRVKY